MEKRAVIKELVVRKAVKVIKLLTRMGADGWVTVSIMELEVERAIRNGLWKTYFEGVGTFALFIKEVTKVHIYFIY